MNFIKSISSWFSLLSIILLIQGISILLEKHTPIFAKKKLEGSALKSWRKIHFLGDVTSAIGFYCFTLSKNLNNLGVKIQLLINIIGLILIFSGTIIKIANNQKKIGKWSSSM